MVFGLVPRGRLKLQNDTRREMTRKEITFGPLDLKLLRALRRCFQITRIFIVEIIGFGYIIFYKKTNGYNYEISFLPLPRIQPLSSLIEASVLKHIFHNAALQQQFCNLPKID